MNKIVPESESKLTLIASSGNTFDIQLVEQLGYIDMMAIIKISKDLSDIFGNNSLLTEFSFINVSVTIFSSRRPHLIPDSR